MNYEEESKLRLLCQLEEWLTQTMTADEEAEALREEKRVRALKAEAEEMRTEAKALMAEAAEMRTKAEALRAELRTRHARAEALRAQVRILKRSPDGA